MHAKENPSRKWRKEKGDDVRTSEKAASLRGDAHVAGNQTCFAVAVAANLGDRHRQERPSS
jgi:hypothetical protein